jgi:putative hydrolase of the HAD superfamily
VAADGLSAPLSTGFPWHDPETVHLHLSTPDLWWEDLEPHLRRSFEAAGVDPSVSGRAAARVRGRYCEAEAYELFPDTVPALQALRKAGWILVILSNHVPELPSIVEGAGLGGLVDEVFSSASTGYEKPHPEAFRIALAGTNPSDCFMVGDNPEADVLGAERIGLRGILVRSRRPAGAVRLILGA